MSILPIVIAPDPILKLRAVAVEKVDEDIRQLMSNMLETMYNEPGIGLAAPQVGQSLRVIVLDISVDPEEKKPLKMANPVIISASKQKVVHEEGCLSLPQFYAEVIRPQSVSVKYLNENNEQKELEADGLLSTCIQHEIDHLDGVLFVDHISSLKRNIILRKLVKYKRNESILNFQK